MVYLPGEEGQGLAEYGLVIVLIAMVVVIILTIVGSQISTMFSTIMEELPFG